MGEQPGREVLAIIRSAALGAVVLTVGGAVRPAGAATVVVTPAQANVQCTPNQDPVTGVLQTLEVIEARETSYRGCFSQMGDSSGLAQLQGKGLALVTADGHGTRGQAEVVARFVMVEKVPPKEEPPFVAANLRFDWSFETLAGAAQANLHAVFVSPNGVGGYSFSDVVEEGRSTLPGGPPPDHLTGARDYSLIGKANVEYWFTLEAVCGTGPSFDGLCRAWIDPVITFDQARFDALRGDQTFKLDDYYEIVLSPNFGGPVPEPATGVLVWLGVAGLAAARARRAGSA